MADRLVEPFAVAQIVETFVDGEHRAAVQYSNRSPLDDSGVFDLHTLAARIYALGFNEGATVEGWRKHEAHNRARDIAASVSSGDTTP